MSLFECLTPGFSPISIDIAFYASLILDEGEKLSIKVDAAFLA